jgi:hypothetical protein
LRAALAYAIAVLWSTLKTNVRVQRVGPGGQGFVQDAVAPDVFQGDAGQLVLVEVFFPSARPGSGLRAGRAAGRS